MEPVRKALASLDPTLPFIEIETMSDEVQTKAADERNRQAPAGWCWRNADQVAGC
jgi:hypothetical protein